MSTLCSISTSPVRKKLEILFKFLLKLEENPTNVMLEDCLWNNIWKNILFANIFLKMYVVTVQSCR